MWALSHVRCRTQRTHSATQLSQGGCDKLSRGDLPQLANLPCARARIVSEFFVTPLSRSLAGAASGENIQRAPSIRTALVFIVEQILVAEEHAELIAAGVPGGEALASLLPNHHIPFGLRTVSGEFNHVIPGQSALGAAGF